LPTVTKKIRVEGRVQGVWYRKWTVDQAVTRRLSGWVRNHRDGSVEAVFSGSEQQVEEMVALCWKGPPAARVTRVSEQTVPLPVADGFRQLDSE